MFYGRVDVYWPDGPVESYRLNKPTVAIGRSTGNDIVLDTTAISRYHITLAFSNQQVLVEDLESVNGTYVDGVRLPPHESYPLRGGEELQIGDIRLIFHPPSEITQISTEADTTQRITLSQPSYRIELQGPDMGVAPGAHVQALLKIENLSDDIDRYITEIDGLPKGWVRVDRVEMEVSPGEQSQAVISFKPLRRSETQPGEHSVTVRVRSKSNPSETAEIPTLLQVLPYSGFGMALGTTHIQDGQSLKLYIHNQGNAPLPISIRGVDPANALRIQMPNSQLQLGPGERQTLSGRVSPRRRRLFGSTREREFAILAQAHDPSGFLAAIPGKYSESGLLPAWTPIFLIPLVALSALLLVGMVLLLVGGGDDDGEPVALPVIQAFSVSNDTLVLGEGTEVQWSIVDAEAVELVIENSDLRQRLNLDPAAVSYFASFDQTGLYNLTLEAHNGDLVSTASAAIEVRPLVSLRVEVLDGVELIRNVEHTVRVNWTVSGAREFDGGYSIWFESSDQVAPLVPAPLSLTGSREFPVIPLGDQAEWLITLYAEGQDNVVAIVTQKVDIVYPSCELSATRTVIRSGPGEIYPAVVPPLPSTEGMSEGNLSLSPLARDASGEWLQVRIGVDDVRLGWVPRADFVCTNFDPARLVVTDDFPLPPESTPAPDDELPITPAVGASPAPSPTLAPSSTPAAITPPATTPADAISLNLGQYRVPGALG